MRALMVGTLALAACFNPKLGNEPFRCGAGGDCPPGYHCDERDVCVLHDVDGGTGTADGPTGADARRRAPMRRRRSPTPRPAPAANSIPASTTTPRSSATAPR